MSRIKRTRRYPRCLIGVGFLLSSFLALPAEDDEKRQELARIQARIQTINKSLDAMESQKNSLRTQLREIEYRYGLAAALLRALERQVEGQQRQLSENKVRRERLRDSIEIQRKELDGQVRAAHAIGGEDLIKLILNQQEPAKTSRILIIMIISIRPGWPESVRWKRI